MKGKKDNSRKKAAKRKQGGVEIRDDLTGSKGKDLSYLNEMPQMGGYEGVVAGAPPPKEEEENKKSNDLADES